MTIKKPSTTRPGAVPGSLVLTMSLILLAAPPTSAQLPGLPNTAKPAAPPKNDPSQKPVPTKDSTGAVFATTPGPIAVNKKVDDTAIASTLTNSLSQFPGVFQVEVEVKDGVVRLEGHVDDRDTLSAVTAFAEKVEGARLIINRMLTDSDVLTGRQMAAKVLGHYGRLVESNWLLAILAVGFAVGFGMLARFFSRYSETLLAPFFGNPLLRSVVGSILSTLIVLGGILLALQVLNLTHAVVSVLGLAGVAGLALGFAFRDIAENFIASMLLGVRRPFQIGDFITVAGKSGSVLSLDTRATLLITPEGNHVRIPNSVIYKETLINASATPSTLGTIELLISYESSTAEALDAINQSLQSTDGLLQEPPPRALVQGLETNGVKLKATYWMPTKGIDGDKLQSDLRLKVKVALQKAGITPPSTNPTVSVSNQVPAELFAPKTNGSKAEPVQRNGHAAPAPVAPPSKADDNLRKDSEAAASSAGEVAAPALSPIDHAIKQAEANAVAEGNNMLVNAKA